MAHRHLHVIPRRAGDVANLRGGVRTVTKSCTRTGWGVFAGRQARPPFLNGPTNFFLVSTEIAGCARRWAARTCRAM
ncbi:MAG: hypothetical protein ABJA98_06985 [Acidobacteriota bacterium]